MLKESVFQQRLIRENCLDRDGFKGWAFCGGMLFGSRAMWWGERRRSHPHEGLDFLFYRNGLGMLLALESSTRIPVAYDGTVICLVDDFLGISVFVEHRFREYRRPLISIYGHTRPFERIRAGATLNEGEIIGTLGRGSKGRARPHLHLSLGWVENAELCSELDWKGVNDAEAFTLINPLLLLEGGYTLTSPEEEKSCLGGLD